MIVAEINSFCKLGIPNPSLADFLAISLYVTVVLLCYAVFALQTRASVSKFAAHWKRISLIVLILGLNKFLCLHCCAAYGLRQFAIHSGWYSLRAKPQLAFILLCVIIFLLLFARIIYLFRQTHKTILITYTTCALMFLLILIRTVSLHQIDAILYRSLFMGIQFNLVLEVLALLLVGLQAFIFLQKSKLHFEVGCK